MGNLFGGVHFWIILLIVLLLFGAPKLPALARSLGQSMKILKKEVGGDDKGEGKVEDIDDSDTKSEKSEKSE